MEYAEQYAAPTEAYLSPPYPRRNEFKELFYLRWGRLHFRVDWGVDMNVKVIVKVFHEDGTFEQYVVHTDACDVEWNRHRRATRDIFIHPQSMHQGRVTCVKFSYILHHQFRSIPSKYEYIFMDGHEFNNPGEVRRHVTEQWATPNPYRTHELDAWQLQRDVDYMNHNFHSLNLVPKFTKGQAWHPYHPKRYIHDFIDTMIWRRQSEPGRPCAIKVCVDCIDDGDFIRHLVHAHRCGVPVQCVVDWRKMTLTNSGNYLALKRSGIELLGDVCTTHDPSAEVATDMHNKFIVFGDEDCIVGSFNVTFDRWGSNWESGMAFRSRGMCNLLDNIFQACRGGVVQRYGIDPFAPFNLLYTFGRSAMLNGRYYRPHHAILAEINRARHSIHLCLFLIGELRGEHGDSVVDALINAWRRGVYVRVILNGHLAWEGDVARERTMHEELNRPLLPAVRRLQEAGLPIALVYGVHDRPIPYSPIHSKQCVVDGHVVLDGSFNWYNTSIFSHDILMVVNNHDVARLYLEEAQQILDSFRVHWISLSR
jgi:hypothetical protein